MREICDECAKEVDFEKKTVVTYVRIDTDNCYPVEVRCMVCPYCGEGYIIDEDLQLIYKMRKMLQRGKYKLLHWNDILQFQKQIGWSDEQLSEAVGLPMPIAVRVADDDTLDPVYDKKLRERMSEIGYKPQYDTIEL